MKLKSVYIEKYKNLSPLTIDFELGNGLTMLVGNNGSGKSNRHQERMRLMLINKYYWNVALLTLLLSGNETLKPFIENDLGITSISTIELKFNFKYFDDVKVQFTRDYTG